MRIHTRQRRCQIVHCPETVCKSSACYFLSTCSKETSTHGFSPQHRDSPLDFERTLERSEITFWVVNCRSFRGVKDVSCSILPELYQHSEGLHFLFVAMCSSVRMNWREIICLEGLCLPLPGSRRHVLSTCSLCLATDSLTARLSLYSGTLHPFSVRTPESQKEQQGPSSLTASLGCEDTARRGEATSS